MKLSLQVSNYKYILKMGRVSLPIFFYFFFNCSQVSQKEITLFDGHVYLLKDGETEITKTGVEVNESGELKTLFAKNDLVLYKAIKHKDYNTYLFIDLDSTIVKENIYKTKSINTSKIILYQHMVDSLSEITGITILKNDKFNNRFSKDSLSQQRFIISIDADVKTK
ncbi:hypothetical protein [uncultured Winogradskyella sp.]|uniref:hypothetical protein n=1 Tax=uncultured Winogradskyella sp. TaxID=395353 RepID=UPI00261664AF|nr:hypothetical protein [uncultured Winogradskyella sp.]